MFDGIKNEAGEKDVDCCVVLDEKSERVTPQPNPPVLFKGAICCKRTLAAATDDDGND